MLQWPPLPGTTPYWRSALSYLVAAPAHMRAHARASLVGAALGDRAVPILDAALALGAQVVKAEAVVGPTLQALARGVAGGGSRGIAGTDTAGPAGPGGLHLAPFQGSCIPWPPARRVPQVRPPPAPLPLACICHRESSPQATWGCVRHRTRRGHRSCSAWTTRPRTPGSEQRGTAEGGPGGGAGMRTREL